MQKEKTLELMKEKMRMMENAKDLVILEDKWIDGIKRIAKKNGVEDIRGFAIGAIETMKGNIINYTRFDEESDQQDSNVDSEAEEKEFTTIMEELIKWVTD